MSATFGDQPDDVVTSSHGDVQSGVALSLYPTKVDAVAGTNLLATVATNALGRWEYTDPSLTVVWVRDPGGQVWSVEDPASLSSTYGRVIGVANDTQLTVALASVLDGDTILVYKGAYTQPPMTLTKAATLFLRHGAVITQTAATTGPLLTVTGAGADVKGRGVLDGNKAGQTAANSGVQIGADDVTIKDLTVQNTKSSGVYNPGKNNVKVRRVKTMATDYIGIFSEAVGAAYSGLQVTDCDVDRSTLAAGTIVEGGLKVRGTAAFALTKARVCGNTVSMPVSPTDASAIAIEASFAVRGLISDNETTGGAMGLSVIACDRSRTHGNTVYNAGSYGIEIGGCRRASVVGNTIEGNALTSQGIILSQGNAVYSDGTTLSGNTVEGCVSYSINSQNASRVAITGNTLQGGTSYLLNLTNGNGSTISGNTLEGLGTATKGIVLDTSEFVAVTGNTIDHVTQTGVFLTASSVFTVRYITITGNTMPSVNIPLDNLLSGGATLGENITVQGNSWVWALDWIDYAKDVRSASGVGAPEAVVAGGVGSTFLRSDGGALTTLYVKESGTGNTGWAAK